MAAGAHEKRVLLNRRQGYTIFGGRGAGNFRQGYVVMMKYNAVTTERKKYVLCRSGNKYKDSSGRRGQKE